MNKDQFKGSWQQFKGELKKKWGQVTDDDLLEAEGDYEKFLGVIQRRYGDQKEDVTRWTDEWYSKLEQDEITSRKATESPNQDKSVWILSMPRYPIRGPIFQICSQ
jgi:uncharacterized protein YjbJ (UPF0337 family)